MAKDEAKIKFTAETGEFNEAIRKSESEMAELRAELKKNAAQMDATGETSDGLKKKHELLENQHNATKDKVDALNKKLELAVKYFGEDSAEASRLRTQLTKAETAEIQLGQAVDKANAELKAQSNSADDAETAEKQLEQAVDGANSELKEQTKTAEETSGALSKIGGAVGTAVKAVGAGIVAGAGALVAATEGTREYRTEMGKLDAAYTASGHSTEAATAAYTELYSIIGETDQSVEAAQQISLLADSEEDVAKWSGLAAGVVGKFGDALQPETFFESANETLKLGEATGAFTQMLEQSGGNVEAFNHRLSMCTTEEEKQAVMLEVTEKLLGDAGEAYKENAADIIDSNKATEAWNASLADIGGSIEPVMTGIRMMGAGILSDLSPAVSLIGEGLLGAMNGTEGASETLAEGIGNALNVVAEKVTAVLPTVLSTVTDLIPSILGMITSNAPLLISTVLGLLSDIVSELPIWLDRILDPLMTSDLLPSLIDGLVGVVLAICQELPNILEVITTYIPGIFMLLVGSLLSNLPVLLGGIIGLVMEIAGYLPQIIDSIITELPNLVVMIITALMACTPQLISGAIQLTLALTMALPQITLSLIKAIPSIIVSLVKAIIDCAPSFIQGFKDLWASAKESFGEMIDSFIRVWNELVDFLTPAGNWIYENVIVPVRDFFVELWGHIKDGVQSAWDWCGDILSTVGSWIYDNVISPVVDFFVGLWDSIVSGAQSAWDWCVGLFVGVATWVYDNITAPIVNFITSMWKKVVETYHMVIDPWIEIIRRAAVWANENIVQPIVRFITDLWNKIRTGAQNLWNGIKSTCSTIASWVSTTIIQPVTNFFTNLWNSLKNGVSTAWNWAKNTCSTIASWVNTKIVQPVSQFFTKLWSGLKNGVSDAWSKLKSVFTTLKNWVTNSVVTPLINAFSNIWSKLKNGASSAWSGVKSVFSNVTSWFREKFQSAWTAVKNVFSTGGKIFDGIKDGILTAFKSVVNAVIRGINTVVRVPFNGLNSVLRTLYNISILGVKPFSWLTWRADIPQIPQLAEGGIVDRPTLNIAGEGDEAEAIIPISKLQGYITDAVERTLQAQNIQALAQAVEDLASRPIRLSVNGREFMLATAGDGDSVNGMRTLLSDRGLVLD